MIIDLSPEIINCYEELRASNAQLDWAERGMTITCLLLGELDRIYALKDILNNFINILHPREQKVIRMRFGIGYSKRHLLEEVGKELYVTRERIRQIEIRAINLLRNNIKKDYKNGSTNLFEMINTETEYTHNLSGISNLIYALFDTPQMIEYLNEYRKKDKA